MIPNLLENGLLPVGVHDASLEEVVERFGVRRGTGTRHALSEKLRRFVGEVAESGLFSAVYVDGSYVTEKDSPNDIDLILVLRAGHDFGAELSSFQYNLVARHRVIKKWGFDCLIAGDGTAQLDEHVRFFSRVRGRSLLHKGMVRISLARIE